LSVRRIDPDSFVGWAFGQADGILSRNLVTVRLLGVIAIGALIAVAARTLTTHSDGAIRLRPPPAWSPSRLAAEEPAREEQPLLRLDAPRERSHVDAGVADAARKFAMKFVTPNLKSPESAEFPEGAIRLERLDLLNRTMGGRIEHWFVDGTVVSRNDYGVMVRSGWRTLLARADDSFFPVMQQLGDFEVYRMRGHVAMLAEARQTAWQERQAQAATEKASELAANRAIWKAIDAAKPAEEKARAALKLAVDLLAAGREEPARKRLQEVIDKFPGTNAASKAQELLK
jgi:hypothetical protein